MDGKSLNPKLDDPQQRWLHEDLVVRVMKGSSSGSHVYATNVGRGWVVVHKGMTAYSCRATSSNNCVSATSWVFALAANA